MNAFLRLIGNITTVIEALNPLAGAVVTGIGSVSDVISAWKRFRESTHTTMANAVAEGVNLDSLTDEQVLQMVAEWSARQDAEDQENQKDEEEPPMTTTEG